jgi:CarD family transcriptional regulator
MSFAIGDKVVYPHHGATIVSSIETREVLGADRDYLVLRFDHVDLVLRVPADGTDAVGLRQIMADDEVAEVFAVLRKRDTRTPSNWSRRFKNHTEMLRSGDVYQLAEVVRNLTQRKVGAHLSAGEQRMLDRARQVLLSELSLVLSVDVDEAGRQLDAALT